MSGQTWDKGIKKPRSELMVSLQTYLVYFKQHLKLRAFSLNKQTDLLRILINERSSKPSHIPRGQEAVGCSQLGYHLSLTIINNNKKEDISLWK